MERFKEPPVVLEQEIEEELVVCMAKGIIEVFQRGGRGEDDRTSVFKQDSA